MINHRIKTLESTRAIAFMLVFLSHSGIKQLEGIGRWSVSVFFIMSGFIFSINKHGSELDCSTKGCIKYMLIKVWKLYPLCLITNFAMILFDCIGIKSFSLVQIAIKFIINNLLIYEMFPISNKYLLNGPTWFMGTMVLFYFLSPHILKRVNYLDNKKAKINIALLIIFEALIAVVGRCMPVVPFEKEILKSHIYEWFVYYFPFSRIIEILIGCNLGLFYINDKNRIIENATLKECIVWLFVIVSIDYVRLDDYFWEDVIVCLPSAVLLVYYSSYGQGTISKLLTNKISMYLASISSYGFLIHHVVFKYIESITAILFGFNVEHFGYLNISVGFVLTLLCCEIWKKIQKEINNYIAI